MTKSFNSPAEYSRALRRVEREGIHPSHLALLRAHLAAPRHTLSWRELAPRVGYPNAEAVKLQYGLFARRVARHLGITSRPRGFWLNALAGWGPKPDRRGHTTFTLRPELVTALRQLRWFARTTSTLAPANGGTRALHIVQGGVENGDKALLERLARTKRPSRSWIVPKSAVMADDAVIYVTGYGFFATARIRSHPVPRRGWTNRYGSGLGSIKLIEPAISLAMIRRHVPDLTWAKYPRSITTPPLDLAERVRQLISERRRTGLPALDVEALASASIEELRRVALGRARRSAPARKATTWYRARSQAIRLYVLRRAEGRCEGCSAPAPFKTADGSPYLEPHHTTRLADGGPDHPARVIALCPNCHRRVHHAKDGTAFNRTLKRRLVELESKAA